MQRLLILFALFMFLGAPAHAAERVDQVPLTIAGITLGQDISTVRDACLEDTAMQLRDFKFLDEVKIDPNQFEGVRGGNIGYGNCAKPGTIVWVKLKFDNHNRRFFERLLNSYQKQLGEPHTYEGDAFHIVVAWKWDFVDSEGRRVDILLMHSKDDELRPGVSVKMTLRSHYDTELECWKANTPPMPRHQPKHMMTRNLDDYVPR